MNAFYTATRGAQLFAKGLYAFLADRGWANIDSTTAAFNLVCAIE
jgi:hypothetical protein